MMFKTYPYGALILEVIDFNFCLIFYKYNLQHQVSICAILQELKSVKESVERSYLDQLKELQQMVDLKQKELCEINRVSAEQKHILEDLNERLNASMQSCTEANDIISRYDLFYSCSFSINNSW